MKDLEKIKLLQKKVVANILEKGKKEDDKNRYEQIKNKLNDSLTKIKKIESLISKNKITEAIEILLIISKEDKLEFDNNEIILTKAKLSRLQSDYSKNIISYENYQVTSNQILNSLIEIQSKLDAQLNEKSKEVSTKIFELSNQINIHNKAISDVERTFPGFLKMIEDMAKSFQKNN